MNEDTKVTKAYHFPGISVLVPEQASEIVALDWGIRNSGNIVEQTRDFTLIRYIANIVLFRKVDIDKGSYEDPVKEFDPPIEFRIQYNFFDVSKAVDCDIKNLKLAYWDGRNRKWVIISDPDPNPDPDPAHEYQILPPSTAQVAEAKIRKWIGDPTLAWGK